MCSSDCFLAFLAVLFPPLPVWVKRGICSADSIINIALCILGYVPGLLHAWYIIAAYPDPFDDTYSPLAHGSRSEHIHYYSRVAPAQHPPHSCHRQQPQSHSHAHSHSHSHCHQQPQPQYNTFQAGNPCSPSVDHRHPQYTIIQPIPTSPAPAGTRQPERYTRHEQQTPPEVPTGGIAGEGSSARGPVGQPPSYASIIKGDHKVQTDD